MFEPQRGRSEDHQRSTNHRRNVREFPTHDRLDMIVTLDYNLIKLQCQATTSSTRSSRHGWKSSAECDLRTLETALGDTLLHSKIKGFTTHENGALSTMTCSPMTIRKGHIRTFSASWIGALCGSVNRTTSRWLARPWRLILPKRNA